MVERIELLNLLGFTQYKDGYSLKGIELQGEEDLGTENPIWKLFWKYPSKIFLLTLKLRRFRSYVKGEHSAGKEFHILAAQGKQLLK